MISSITNIQTYVIGYISQQVELEMDITTNRYFLSKILGNNLYLNDFDKFIYIVSASTYYLNSNVGFYQNNRILKRFQKSKIYTQIFVVFRYL